MALSNNLISQFVKMTNDKDKKDTKKETVVYGTMVEDENGNYNSVIIDGSSTSTPVKKAVIAGKNKKTGTGDRVIVTIKNHTAIVTSNLSNPTARAVDTTDKDTVDDIVANSLVANNIESNTIEAINGKIERLQTNDLKVDGSLKAIEGSIDDLKTNTITAINGEIGTLNSKYTNVETLLSAHNARIEYLEANGIETEKIDAAIAFIDSLEANEADINYMVSRLGEIDTLIFGEAHGNVVQSEFSTNVVAHIGNAQIKSAMIDTISADQITVGSINSTEVTIASKDNRLQISDGTILITDGNNPRVQIGKDEEDDYSIVVCDKNGKVMFNTSGITEDAIKEAIIRNDMISTDANIDAKKLNIDSLFSVINGSSNTIKSSQVYLDTEGQSLNLAFKSITDTVTSQGSTIADQGKTIADQGKTITSQSETIASQGSTITAQGKTISEQGIAIATQESKISSQGTQISAIQGQISSKIWQQDINIVKNSLDEQTEALATRYSEIEQNLTGFKAVVSDTYATKEAFDGLEIGGRNLALGTSDEWSNWVIPNADSLNQTHVANYAYLSDTKQIGDEYTVSIEIEFSGVDVGTGGSFLFRTQGSVDDTWSKNNIWAHNLLNTKTPLSDGVYRFFLTTKIDSSNIDATRFDCGFRADYWNGTGKYRYRKIKVEKGSKPTDWSPAPEDLATIKNLNTLSDKVSSAETKITQNYDSITAVATRTTKNENAITSLELTANGLTAKVESAKKELYHSANGSHGVSGYVGLCQLEVTGVHQDRPLLFEFTNRGRQSSTVSLCFSNIDSTDPGIHHLQRDGGIDVWAYKIDTSTWQLIAKKSEAYDTIYVKDYYNTNFYVTVTWTNIHYNTLPDSNITEATLLAGKIEKTVIDNAAKTATNYLNFSSNGLVVGDMTASSLGKNVLIDSDSVDIRNGNTTLASFGADYLYLAKNSRDAKIDLCNSLAQMYHEVDDKGYSVFNIDTTYGLSYIKMSAPMSDLLVLENTNSTNGVIIKGIINGTTVGGFGLLRDGNMVRYGSDADEDNPVENIVLDTGNFLSKMDDGWHYTGGYGDNFTQYNNEDYAKVRYRKIGGMVEIRGVMRPTTIIAGSSTQHELFSLPEGYRPDSYMYQRCQADGVRSWLLTISPSGVVSFSRYGNGTSYIDAETTAWLPFQVTYFVN